MEIEILAGEYKDLVQILTLADGETVFVEFSGEYGSGYSARLLKTTDNLGISDPNQGAFVSADESSTRSIRATIFNTGQNIGLYNTGKTANFTIYKE